MNEIAISVKNLSKDFEIYAKPSDLAIEILTGRKRHRSFRALDDVSFDVRRGDVLGIIGSNGAGKSTLLKLITGVLDPTAGNIEVAGKVTAILELGLGFNPEYSGRDNIYLSGLLYGMDRAEIDRKLDSIIDFSGIEAFIEQPVKTYSSGMQSRLAFSIATAVDPEILIIDEALAAGDSMFVQKCMHRIQTLCRSGHTVLVVSHGTGLLAQLCRRVLWLDQGRVRAIGPALNIIQEYDLTAHQGIDRLGWLEHVDDHLGASPANAAASAVDDGAETARLFSGLGRVTDGAGDAPPPKTIYRRGSVFIEQVDLLNAAGESVAHLMMLEQFQLSITYRLEGGPPEDSLGVALSINNRHDLSPVAQWFTQNIRPDETQDTYAQDYRRVRALPRGVILLDFPYMPLRAGDYILSIGLLPNRPGNWIFHEYRHLYYHFSVDDGGLGAAAPIFLEPVFQHRAAEAPADAAPPRPPPSTVPELMPLESLRGEIARICVERGGYPSTWPRHTRCPACGRNGALPPHFSRYGFNHGRCPACGFVCVDPYPLEEIVRQLYAGAYYTNIREYYELPLLRQGHGGAFSAPRAMLEAIVLRATAGRVHGRWLDVGGGIGTFARLIQTMRPRWDVSLNELNPRSREIAATVAMVAVIGETPADLAATGQTFDVISMMAVLEHCTDPEALLRDYLPLLRPGGLLVIHVPHFTHLVSHVSRGSSPNVVPPYHVSLFSETTLRCLLERLGTFDRIEVEQSGDAAFLLHDHVAFGDHWDVMIPTVDHPEPRGIQVKPYTEAESRAIAILEEAGRKLGDFFAMSDGRDNLLAYARRPDTSDDQAV